jgi:hypothetical protein
VVAKIVLGVIMVMCGLGVFAQTAALVWALANGVWMQVAVSIGFIAVLSTFTVILHEYMVEQ